MVHKRDIDRERIKELRDRLYSRGRQPVQSDDQSASKPKSVPKVPASWNSPEIVEKHNRTFTPKQPELRPTAGKSSTASAVKSSPVKSPTEPAVHKPSVEAVKTSTQPVSPVSVTKKAGSSISQPTISPQERALRTRPEEDSADSPVAKESLVTEDSTMATRKSSRKYRRYLLVGSGAIFVILMLIASFNMLLRDGNISGDNIEVNITGPYTVGSGEVLPLQVVVANNNSVPIEAATLIIEYPPETRSAQESGEELFVDRQPLEQIPPGQIVNIPIKAIIYGEENQEKTITASVEYRIEGSNSSFVTPKPASYTFQITSSPVVLNVSNLDKVSPGEEVEVELEVSSNSTTEINDILIRAEYPSAFDFSSADPDPVSGENVWRIDTLEPEESKTITITGVLTGNESDVQTLHFTAGIGSENEEYKLVSVLSTVSTEFTLEKPFFALDIDVGGSGADKNTVSPNSPTRITIKAKNTLSTSIYDAVIKAVLSGNALADTNVSVSEGFYNSVDNTITWDVSSVPSLAEIPPGETRQVSFTVEPFKLTERTPQILVDGSLKARRVFDSNATEQNLTTNQFVIKVASEVGLISETGYNSSVFADSGPIPPQAEKKTTYTLSFLISNTTNDVGDAVMRAVLPTYVTWLDKTSGAGSISFNESTREVIWEAGNIDANQSKIGSFQVSFLPSVTQIDTTPKLLGEQTLTVTDRFTGTKLSAKHRALTTELSTEAGYPEGNGMVVK